jgi:hypothetical protein
MRDPRLSDEMRHQVAWALLSRTLSGDAYEVDAIALDRVGLGHIASWPGLGQHHLRIIENAMTGVGGPAGRRAGGAAGVQAGGHGGQRACRARRGWPSARRR